MHEPVPICETSRVPNTIMRTLVEEPHEFEWGYLGRLAPSEAKTFGLSITRPIASC